ncbi:MAG: 50S ribosomal protein L24 [Verrucomicrobiota bacterium]
MKRFHVKKGDEVVIIAGTERGKRGKIKEVLRSKDRVVIEGAKLMKKHVRKNQQNPQGAIVELEGSIHVSNVMLAERYDAGAVKRGGAVEETKG